MTRSAQVIIPTERPGARRTKAPLLEGGFRYLSASDVPGDEIVRVLSESFSREPMAAQLGISATDLGALIARFMPECQGNGLSVVAVPEDEPQTVAAAFLSRDFRSPLPDGILEDFPWFLPVAQALMGVGAPYEARHPDLALGDAADLWMVGTESRFARLGIARRLFRIATTLARDHGFRRCVTECTGHYSQAAAQRAGFEEITRLAYREFRFDGSAVFAGIPLPHTHLVLYGLEL